MVLWVHPGTLICSVCPSSSSSLTRSVVVHRSQLFTHTPIIGSPLGISRDYSRTILIHRQYLSRPSSPVVDPSQLLTHIPTPRRRPSSPFPIVFAHHAGHLGISIDQLHGQYLRRRRRSTIVYPSRSLLPSSPVVTVTRSFDHAHAHHRWSTGYIQGLLTDNIDTQTIPSRPSLPFPIVFAHPGHLSRPHRTVYQSLVLGATAVILQQIIKALSVWA